MKVKIIPKDDSVLKSRVFLEVQSINRVINGNDKYLDILFLNPDLNHYENTTINYNKIKRIEIELT